MMPPNRSINSNTDSESVDRLKATQPVLFVSHGAPDLLFSPHPAADALKRLGASLQKPDAIICISPHWQTSLLTLDRSDNTQTLYDFGGFDKRLYQFRYSAPGAPALAERVHNLLLSHDVPHRDQQRGLDHGAWVPLGLMFPQADIPVLQCSLPRELDPEHYYLLGQQLGSLSHDNILILVTGGSVHNLRYLAPGDTQAPEWASAFQNWLVEQLLAEQHQPMMHWRNQSPNAFMAHPTSEHLDGLWIALGAAKKKTPLVVYQGFDYGSLGMLHLRFD